MKRNVIIDADTDNEIDDHYAIIRGLTEKTWNVLGLISTHFATHDFAPESSMEASYSQNIRLLKNMNRSPELCFRGAEKWMGRAWGGDDPVDSEAARFIIRKAGEASPENKLLLAVQGAMTNIASAVKIDPSIVPNIAVHLMGFRYDVQKKIWNKNEFNVRMDLNAADVLLNCEGLEMHIMPAETCGKLMFQKKDVFSRLNDDYPLHVQLRNRWDEHCPDNSERPMWDLALIIAMAEPELAVEQIVPAPPENGGRPVHVYTDINTDAMYDDFWPHLPAKP